MKINPQNKLSADERALKQQCERAIDDGIEKFVQVGNALQTIRDRRLYREDYATFAGYCKTVWAMSQQRARQLRSAAKVMEELVNYSLFATIGSEDFENAVYPQNERQARALTAFDADLRPAILRIAQRTADALQQPLSASLITSVGEQLQLAADTGAVDTGDGTSTVLTAAMTQEVYEAAARQAQHIKDKSNRVTVQGQVFTIPDEESGFARIAVRMDQPGADKLSNLQRVTVIFTPYEAKNEVTAGKEAEEAKHG